MARAVGELLLGVRALEAEWVGRVDVRADEVNRQAIVFAVIPQFLDPRGRRELIRTVLGLPTTILLATHDLDMVLDTCPRTIVLDAGRIAADGPTAELLANAELMETHGLEVPGQMVEIKKLNPGGAETRRI